MSKEDTNVYYESNANFFVQLRELVVKNPFSYFSMLDSKGFYIGNKFHQPKYKHLKDWIDQLLPQLDGYKTSTKVFWILNGLKDFPKCYICERQFEHLNVGLHGYPKYCSQDCQHKGLKKEVSESKSICKRNSIDAKLNQMDEFEQIHFLIENFKDSYPKMILARKNLKSFLLEKTSFAKGNYKISTRIFFLLNNITSWDSQRVRCKICNNPLYSKQVGSIATMDFPTYCSQECIMADEDIQKKIEDTCRKEYNVKSPAQNYEIQKKIKGNYLYDGLNFNSSWEIAFYIYHKDKGIPIEYNPEVDFRYEDQTGTSRRYFPDFLVDGKLYEIKGEQFINEDGTFKNPFDQSKSASIELKRQCALRNDVTILRLKDIKHILKYIKDKYGNSYLKQFKRKTLNK